MNLDNLVSQVEGTFYLIGGAILLIEIAEMLFKGEFKGKKFIEMIASAELVSAQSKRKYRIETEKTWMGMEKIDFFWYLKKIAWLAFVGFVAGAITFILLRDFVLHG